MIDSLLIFAIASMLAYRYLLPILVRSINNAITAMHNKAAAKRKQQYINSRKPITGKGRKVRVGGRRVTFRINDRD